MDSINLGVFIFLFITISLVERIDSIAENLRTLLAIRNSEMNIESILVTAAITIPKMEIEDTNFIS